MAYTTQADLELAAGGPDRFVDLADWDGDGVADADVVARAQADADATINRYLRGRYTCPIANPTPELRNLAADLAVYWIKKTKGMTALTLGDVEDQKGRIDVLEQYRSGSLRFESEEIVKSDRGRSVIISPDDDAEVSRESLKGMW
ncbi:MAG: DUF1320 domain-containing protein [Chloroflexi bacterium]|nr:DUF1320 domain-containing protein [Chloroflexota bacterium]